MRRESSKDKSAQQKNSSIRQTMSDLCLQVDISLHLNQLLIKYSQILAIFDVQHINVHDMQSTDDVTVVLSHLEHLRNSTLCYTENRKEMIADTFFILTDV